MKEHQRQMKYVKSQGTHLENTKAHTPKYDLHTTEHFHFITKPSLRRTKEPEFSLQRHQRQNPPD